MIKYFIKQVTPPCLISLARKLRSKIVSTQFYGVEGNFATWQEALDFCANHQHKEAYESFDILEKVANAIQEVRKGNAEFERDSFLFYKKDYNFQLLSALFLAFNGIDGDESIQVVDFGGSLGSTFFQNRSLFNTMNRSVVWNVIEQKQFVERGRKEVPEIYFYNTIEEYIDSGGQCDILLLSSVLEYMEYPYEILRNLLKYKWKYIIIERSQYSPYGEDRIMVQTVPPTIYDAQYPLWLRSEDKQHNLLSENGYDKILDWILPFSIIYKDERGSQVIPFKGFMYKII